MTASSGVGGPQAETFDRKGRVHGGAQSGGRIRSRLHRPVRPLRNGAGGVFLFFGGLSFVTTLNPGYK